MWPTLLGMWPSSKRPGLSPNARCLKTSAVRACCQTFLSAPDDDGTSLLAIVVRSDCVTSLDITSHPRAMSVVWYYGGCYDLRLYNIYGAAVGTEQSFLSTSTIVRDLLIDAEASGRVPSLIAGDFNLEFSQLHCLGNLVASDWKDIGSEPTCAVGSTTVPPCIDMLLANAAFRSLITGYPLEWASGSLLTLPSSSLSSTGRRLLTMLDSRRPLCQSNWRTSLKSRLGPRSPPSWSYNSSITWPRMMCRLRGVSG